MISTAVEICGFSALSAAAWEIHPVFGLFVVGACLLFVGYALEDEQAVVRARRVVARVVFVRAMRRQRRAERRAARRNQGHDGRVKG